MEIKVNRPALAGQDIDPDTFQRVWDRVMPGQTSPAAREGDSTPDTAVPAEPSTPPQEVSQLPPVPACPPDTEPSLPPVPDCPAESTPNLPSVPDCPADSTRPSVPNCPAQPETPTCPSCPETPSTPPESPALCLGEASRGDRQRLEALMTLARTGAAAARALARRSNGPTYKAMSALASDHRLAFRRLSAAYFLITGQRYTPKCITVSLPSSLPLALRQQFVWEQQWEQKNNQAAQDTADPCLKELYLELAQEGAFHAGTIRSILEQMG